MQTPSLQVNMEIWKYGNMEIWKYRDRWSMEMQTPSLQVNWSLPQPVRRRGWLVSPPQRTLDEEKQGENMFFFVCFFKSTFHCATSTRWAWKSRVGTGAICLVKISCPIFHRKNLPSRVGVVARKLGDFVLFAFHKPLVWSNLKNKGIGQCAANKLEKLF